MSKATPKLPYFADISVSAGNSYLLSFDGDASWLWIQNQHATNDLTIYLNSSGNGELTLAPGQEWEFPPNALHLQNILFGGSGSLDVTCAVMAGVGK